jgi:hypothetical protein
MLKQVIEMMGYRFPDHLSPNTQASSAIKFLQDKYLECSKHHVECRDQDLRRPFYPSRVLDVGGKDDRQVFLRDTCALNFRSSYTALSHCWGLTRPFVLDGNTKTALISGLSVDKLPRTFQDAIVVTHHLQIRYLWIDSL